MQELQCREVPMALLVRSATRPSLGTHLVGQATLQHAVPGNLAYVTGAEFEDLGSDGILLHQGLL